MITSRKFLMPHGSTFFSFVLGIGRKESKDEAIKKAKRRFVMYCLHLFNIFTFHFSLFPFHSSLFPLPSSLFPLKNSSYRLAASSSVLMMPFGRPNYRTNQCQITENSRNVSILPNEFTPNY